MTERRAGLLVPGLVALLGLAVLIGLGTWQTFDVGASTSARAPLREVLEAFAGAGGRLVDSSPMYGNSELVTGDLMAALGLRSKLFIATKVWTRGKAAGVRQMEESMRLLRAQPIDLMQVHNLVDVDTHLETLAEWKRAGRVRYVGITHYTASAHDAMPTIRNRWAIGENHWRSRSPEARSTTSTTTGTRSARPMIHHRRTNAGNIPSPSARSGPT